MIPPFMNKFFRYPKFSETLNGCPRIFSVLRDMKISIENRDMPPHIHKFFLYQKFSGKRKRSFTKIFVSVLWDKKFRQNRDAPFLCMKVFDKRFFLKRESVLQWNILVQSDQKFSKEKCDNPYQEESFSIPQIFWNIEGMPTNFFGTARHENFDWKSWYAPSNP